MRHIFIGDIHGCASELDALIRMIRYQKGTDRLYMPGDLFTKGPNPLEVWKTVGSTGANVVLGNHDAELMVRMQARQQGADESDLDPSHIHTLDQLKPVADEFLADWGAALGDYLARAPRRGDMAVPYLSWRLAAGDDAAILAVASRILAGDRDNPVGLWFSGTVLIATPQTAAEGIARMRRALAQGLERVMPVDAALKSQIRSAPGTNGN